jgi:RNA polymerase sigma-70 factor (ECF subfamily)
MDEPRPDLETVYRTYHPRLLRYLNRLIGADEAEDVAQDVFAKIGQALPEFRNESQLSTWIYRIATNAAVDRVRSAAYRAGARGVPIGGAGEGDAPGHEIPAPACSAEHQVIRDEMSECVQDLVRKLPEDYQVVLALSETEELKDREIAEVLGVTVETAKIRLHRARAKLRQSLESRCAFYRNSENTLLCDIKRAPPKS